MKLEVLADAESVARRAAALVAEEARAAVADRGRFALAVSGGSTPWVMLRALAGEELPWPNVHVFQIDERRAPDGHADRNLTHLHESFAAAPLPAENLHPMPVGDDDLEAAAARYARELAGLAGDPPALDLAHLGLGPDGHTASLVPDDAVLEVADRDVAWTAGDYQGRRRMTVTYPLLARARRILWLVTGAGKGPMLARLQAGDASIPAGRVASAQALVLADTAAAG